MGKAIADDDAGPVTRGMRDGALSAEKADAVVTGLAHLTDRVNLSEEKRAKVVGALLVQTTPARVPVAERDDLNAMTMDRTDDGRVAVTLDLDTLAAEELWAALDPLTRPVPEPDGSEDTRSAKRRRADAVTQVVRTYLSHSDRPESGGVLPEATLPTRCVVGEFHIDVGSAPHGAARTHPVGLISRWR
ncbi:DUF222 domain-containing protein [Gordonia alkaliphila]|uniref:DUF222 domain-containing protein n=1 Tax=Gordonia alkaliphila TaxID=1053547 RepID=A0ABP8Z9G2_9ACTN|nr:DUF222 domain-containing protein [Gordonia alkaliphila]MCK0440803.1 DUF222 domain-containing protein [Gordonia alkaliphila]